MSLPLDKQDGDVWITVQMRAFGLDRHRASLMVQELIGSMYQPYGSDHGYDHGYDHAAIWITDEAPTITPKTSGEDPASSTGEPEGVSPAPVEETRPSSEGAG